MLGLVEVLTGHSFSFIFLSVDSKEHTKCVEWNYNLYSTNEMLRLKSVRTLVSIFIGHTFIFIFLLALLKSVHFKNKVAQSSVHLKIMIFFNNTSADIKTKSAVELLKMIILSELRIAQLCS